LVPFKANARAVFDPIAAQHGLAAVDESEWYVRYDNDHVSLSVEFGNGRSYELSVSIGQKLPNKPPRPFLLEEILRLKEAPEAASINAISASTIEQLRQVLRLLATLTTLYGGEFLAGEAHWFSLVADLRHRESLVYAAEARSRAEQARLKLQKP
jgi:hypothetical protein